MNDIFKGFEQLLELAKTLEEKVDKGEMKTEFTVRSLSSIPHQGNIPRSSSRPTQEVIVTPPPPNHTPDRTTANSLSQVGGLDETIAELRELIEIPLKRPELLAKLGLEPPRGVLLVGPQGRAKP